MDSYETVLNIDPLEVMGCFTGGTGATVRLPSASEVILKDMGKKHETNVSIEPQQSANVRIFGDTM